MMEGKYMEGKATILCIKISKT